MSIPNPDTSVASHLPQGTARAPPLVSAYRRQRPERAPASQVYHHHRFGKVRYGGGLAGRTPPLTSRASPDLVVESWRRGAAGALWRTFTKASPTITPFRSRRAVNVQRPAPELAPPQSHEEFARWCGGADGGCAVAACSLRPEKGGAHEHADNHR